MVTGNDFVNGLRLYQGQMFSGLVDDNMLTQALMKKPYEMGTLVSYIFGTQDDGYSSVLDFITGGLGNVKIVDDNWYEWGFILESERAVTIRKAMWNGQEITSANLNTTPGLHGSTIKLWLEDKWFGPGSILEFDDKRYQARVEQEPYMDGNEYVYTVRLSGQYVDSYILPELLLPGKQVSRVGSAYPEYSDEADILNYSTPFKLRNTLTTMRLDYSITGHAYSTVLAIEIQDPETKKSTYYWATYQDWKAIREWVRRIDYQLMHDQFAGSITGYTNAGTNGYPVYRGAGLRQQISPANKSYYSYFSLDLLQDFLLDLSYNILGTSERKFLALTGEMGMIQFDRAVKKEAANLNLVDTKFVTGSGMELAFGGQFTTYKMPQGIEFTVRTYSPYDNTVHNRDLHPVSKKPIESYRYTILDIGRRDGKANIVKVMRKDRGFIQWYTGGSVGPNGYAKSKDAIRSNAKDGYTVHFLGEQGIMIVDPRACGELIMELA